jgi:hypothetical protein
MNTQLPMRAIALSLLFASGCQAPVQLHRLQQPLFAFGQADQAVPATAAANLPASASGRLTVRFDGELARMGPARRIQATVADVEKVVVTVTPQGGTAVSKTVLKAAITGGQTSVTFDGLPPGAATVTIAAFDAAGVNIGATSQQATITVGQVASLNVGLQLNPTYTPGSGSGGAGGTGGIAADIQLTDGVTVTASGTDTLTYAGSYNPGWPGTALAIDAQGNAWLGGAYGTFGWEGYEGGRLAKLSPTGDVALELPLGSPVMDVAVDPQGDVWMATEMDTGSTSDTMFRLAPDGTTLESFDVVSGMKAIAMDATGWPWVSNHGIPTRFKPGQRTRIAYFNAATMNMPVDIAVDGHGHVWLVSDGSVECYQADGTRLITIPTAAVDVQTAFAACAISVDVNGDVWAIDSAKVLRRFNHAGVKQGEWPGYGQGGLTTFGSNSQRLTPDPRGGVWVRSEKAVTRLNAQGQVLAQLTFSVAQPAGGLAVDASGLWLTYGSQVHRFTF